MITTTRTKATLRERPINVCLGDNFLQQYCIQMHFQPSMFARSQNVNVMLHLYDAQQTLTARIGESKITSANHVNSNQNYSFFAD